MEEGTGTLGSIGNPVNLVLSGVYTKVSQPEQDGEAIPKFIESFDELTELANDCSRNIRRPPFGPVEDRQGCARCPAARGRASRRSLDEATDCRSLAEAGIDPKAVRIPLLKPL